MSMRWRFTVIVANIDVPREWSSMDSIALLTTRTGADAPVAVLTLQALRHCLHPCTT